MQDLTPCMAFSDVTVVQHHWRSGQHDSRSEGVTHGACLQGDLERGIVPAECVWMHGGGAGEDGCLLLLRKMNLELLRRSAPGVSGMHVPRTRCTANPHPLLHPDILTTVCACQQGQSGPCLLHVV